jgi:hypothetical protein
MQLYPGIEAVPEGGLQHKGHSGPTRTGCCLRRCQRLQYCISCVRRDTETVALYGHKYRSGRISGTHKALDGEPSKGKRTGVPGTSWISYDCDHPGIYRAISTGVPESSRIMYRGQWHPRRSRCRGSAGQWSLHGPGVSRFPRGQ